MDTALQMPTTTFLTKPAVSLGAPGPYQCIPVVVA